jgi:NAD(P)-dependent dehydrogenase (short-subunit alcohol dehydrogenase family)
MTSATKTLAVVGAGFSIAMRFGAAGFQVALLARSADKLDGLAGDLDKLGLTARAYVADLADRSSVAAALARVEEDLGAIDVLEFSPVPGGAPVPAAETTPEDVLASFEPQVLGAVATVNAVLPGMRSRKVGVLCSLPAPPRCSPWR